MCNTADVPEHRGPGRINSWTTLIVLVSLLFAATTCFADGESVTSCSDSSSATIATKAVAGPAFRLGDAARPFGWSTVVSDFNHDGIPDLAIADRTPERQNEFRYQIEFAVAGRKPYDVTFTSSLQAVTLQPNDVDGDRDVDIVVVDPISNDVVGVWLNDGEGHFAAANPRAFFEHRQSTLEASGRSVNSAACLSRGQNQDSLPRPFGTHARLPVRERLPRLRQSLSATDDASPANPRAPPSFFQS